MLLVLGTTTYGSFSAFSGFPAEVSNAVPFWNQGSVSSLQAAVISPSQSTSMSAFQNTAPFLPQTGMVAEVSSSVRYLPLEICEHEVTLASRSAALTDPSLRFAPRAGPAWAAGPRVTVASRAAPEAAARASVRVRTVGVPFQ